VEASEDYFPNNSSIPIERIVESIRGGFKPDPSKASKGQWKIVYRIKEDPGLIREAEKACKNKDVQEDGNHLEEQLAKGNDNPGVGCKYICKGVIEHRGKNGGRLYIRKVDDRIEIVGKSGKDKKNQQAVIKRLKEIYG
jgi:hypothetical protein